MIRTQEERGRAMTEHINTRELGAEQELIATRYLLSRGFRILHRNYRIRIGEIDLVALDGDTLVFIEVKYRRTARCGEPETAVTERKQHTIYRVAQHYLQHYGYGEGQPCRFDVISIFGEEIRHYKDAFGGI